MSRPAVCQTAPSTAHSAIADLPTQRVWLLEQRDLIHGARFAGAVLMLADEGVYVVVVISHDPAFASERGLHGNRLRCQLPRDIRTWPTLDAALAHADQLKQTRIDRGWIEVKEEPLERATI